MIKMLHRMLTWVRDPFNKKSTLRRHDRLINHIYYTKARTETVVEQVSGVNAFDQAFFGNRHIRIED